MKVYLDNCCYNRPYDDQSQLRISLETQAKLQIQSTIKEGKIKLVSSYVLLYENSKNPHEIRKRTIYSFIKENIDTFVYADIADKVKEKADAIIETGVKTVDSYHIACAIISKSDYFITTDDRVLKYKTNEIKILDPIQFIKEMEEIL